MGSSKYEGGWNPAPESDDERAERESVGDSRGLGAILAMGCIVGLTSLGAIYGSMAGAVISPLARDTYSIKRFSRQADEHTNWSIRYGAKVGAMGFPIGTALMLGGVGTYDGIKSRRKKKNDKKN